MMPICIIEKYCRLDRATKYCLNIIIIIRNSFMFPFLLTAVLPYLFFSSYAEVFTAIADLEPLLETRKMVIDNLDLYIKKEEQRILLLKRQWILYEQEHNKSMEDVSNYLGNPINAFSLIKSLTTDLDFVEGSISEGTEYIKNESVKYPTPEDLTGAARALARLQETYKLNVRDLSEGMLNGENYGTSMTVSDCFDLGMILCKEKAYRNALEWMTEAYRKIKEDKETPTHLKMIDVMDSVEDVSHLSGNSKTTLEWISKLLEVQPAATHESYNASSGNALAICYKNIIEENKIHKKHLQDEELEIDRDWGQNLQKKFEGKWDYPRDVMHRKYQTLCRGGMDISPEFSKRLKCWYTTNNHAFLKYAPIKVEQAYRNPDIFIFHGVLNDNEIELLKAMAKPRFERASFHNSKTGVGATGNYRIGKVAWLRDEESPVVARVSQRVADITGLDLETAEELQVFNYGIGGHYEPHCDFASNALLKKNKPSFYTSFGRNRIATVLLYMSDVALGGATVFTELGLTLFPIKGAAVFWWNLHPSGEGDMATRHAACPVLKGSKWVSNKWIHEVGQELIKPCDLKYQEEGFSRRLPRPIPRSR